MDEQPAGGKLSALNAGTVRIGSFHINRIGLGAMRITGNGAWGEGVDREYAKQLLRRAVELDVNFIDTADAYGPGVSEDVIAEALHPYEGIIVATKGGYKRPRPDIWTSDCSPEHLQEACEGSSQRLKVSRIDIYQLHTVDQNVDFRKSYQTLLELQAEGRIRYIGLSNIEPEHFKIALSMGPFVCVQNNYSIFNREHEDVLKLCEREGIAFIPYFPIGGGRDFGDDTLSTVAARHAASPRQVALAWLLAHSPVMLPIPGTSKIEHLEENIAAAALKLNDEEMTELDDLVRG